MKYVLSVLAACLASADTLAASEKPNIVFVLADDMGYGDASCFNKSSKIQTTHLDKLASQGMRFTDAHSGAARRSSRPNKLGDVEYIRVTTVSYPE